MKVLYCSTCSQSFDPEIEGIVGNFGIIPVAFCGTCRVGIHDLAQIEWDLVPRTALEQHLCTVCQEVACECESPARRQHAEKNKL